MTQQGILTLTHNLPPQRRKPHIMGTCDAINHFLPVLQSVRKNVPHQSLSAQAKKLYFL